MTPFVQALVFAGIAGAAIPLGAALSRIENLRPGWAERELRHSVAAFGGGALLSAVALVLVPEGITYLSLPAVAVWFLGGGLAFAALDRYLARHQGAMAQFVAMLSDFIPESIALGAAFVANPATGRLLALLIAIQNLPEAFNADREVARATGLPGSRLMLLFALLAGLGPICAFVGLYFLAASPAVVGAIMLFAAGGILYLTFQDIAPQVPLRNSFGPPLGAVLGFFVGLAGNMLI